MKSGLVGEICCPNSSIPIKLCGENSKNLSSKLGDEIMNIQKVATIFLLLSIVLSGCSPAAPAGSAEQPTVANATQVLPTSTQAPQPTATVEKKVEPTETPVENTATPTEPAANSRFVPIYPSNTFHIDSDEADKSWGDFINSLARNQAIPTPFEWQLAEFPDETRWAEIYDYFKNELLDKGWSITSDGGDWITIAGGNQMYVGGFIKKEADHREKISILFYPKSKDYKSFYVIFYSQLK
jgi:hypothetical protein